MKTDNFQNKKSLAIGKLMCYSSKKTDDFKIHIRNSVQYTTEPVEFSSKNLGRQIMFVETSIKLSLIDINYPIHNKMKLL